MDERTNDRSSMGNEEEPHVRRRSRTLRGGHDPSKLGRLSVKARRERAGSRGCDAEQSKLTLRARLAVIAASELDEEALRAVIRGLKHRAQGDGHVANGAAKLLLELARAAVEDEPVEDDAVALEDMTPAQKAALLARIDRELARRDEGEDRDGDQPNPDDATFPRTGSSARDRVDGAGC